MKSKLVLNLLLMIFSIVIYGQEKEIINPKGNLYFGANIGLNNIGQSTSTIVIETNYNKKSFQIGAFAEYYFAKQWSITSKMSYFETGLDYFYYYPGTNGYFFSSPSKTNFANFSGEVLTTSLQMKWEFRLVKNFKGYLKLGVAYYVETKSDYQNYINDQNNENYPSNYGSWVSGYGFTYFLNQKYALFIESEFHMGTSKYNSGSGLFGNGDRYASNQLLSIGVKYNFKSSKNKY